MKIKRWTETEERYLTLYFYRDGAARCAKRLGRTIDATRLRHYQIVNDKPKTVSQALAREKR